MGDTQTQPGAPDPTAEQAHQNLIDAVLFKRNLDEVFLLLDFVSGRPDRDLAGLSMPDPDGGAKFDAQKVVTHLASIRYPREGQTEQRGRDASFLLLAKDRLTWLAHPARGLTIAYTALFTGTETGRHAGQRQPVGSPVSLAAGAFPGLRNQVRWFKRLYIVLICVTLVWLLLTSLAYWDAAMGRSIIQRIDQIHKDRAALYQVSADITQEKTCARGAANRPIGCMRADDLGEAETLAKADLIAFTSCSSWSCVRWLHVMRWGFILCGVDEQLTADRQKFFPVDPQPTVAPLAVTADRRSVASILSVYSNYVLPMMFGVLGTFIAAIRMVQINVRDSTLSPRDFWGAFLSLPLGMVAGVAVSLFYSPTGAPTTGGGDSTANLTLTTCGLGFLAGYGSQTFFDMLDALKKNAFLPNGDSSKPQRPA